MSFQGHFCWVLNLRGENHLRKQQISSEGFLWEKLFHGPSFCQCVPGGWPPQRSPGHLTCPCAPTPASLSTLKIPVYKNLSLAKVFYILIFINTFVSHINTFYTMHYGHCHGPNKDLNFTYRGKMLTRVDGTDLYSNCLGTEAGKLQVWGLLDYIWVQGQQCSLSKTLSKQKHGIRIGT